MVTTNNKFNCKRIGILGGTFDPIHTGHLIVAEIAYEKLNLDCILFVLSPSPPHKELHNITALKHRLKMLHIAIDDNPSFEFSNADTLNPNLSYTVDTLKYLISQKVYNKSEFFFLIGMDNLVDFHKWRSPNKILEYARLVVYPREGIGLDLVNAKFRENCILLNGPRIEISSTEIRCIKRNEGSIRYLVPDKVRLYIEKNRLY